MLKSTFLTISVSVWCYCLENSGWNKKQVPAQVKQPGKGDATTSTRPSRRKTMKIAESVEVKNNKVN